jgi:ABC-2 type transport system permease protein
MSRLLKIARREYLAYVRTAGFWISLLLTPVGLSLGILGPTLLSRSEPPPRIAIVDLTGEGFTGEIARALAEAPATSRSPAAARGPAAVIVPSPTGPAGSAEAAGRKLRPYLVRTRDAPARLDMAAVIHSDPAKGVAVDFWSRNLSDRAAEDVVKEAVAARMTALKLQSLGVKPADIASASDIQPKVTDYAAGAGKKAGLKDRLPGFAGFGLGMLLWMMIFTSAGILLNSVIEEKSTRVLEVLLASASAGEVMGGKILGVAAVTATVLAAWFLVGGGLLASGDPSLFHDILAVLTAHGLILTFAVYLVGGYLMYASLFVAIGAHCETNREAQTLLAPMMLLTTIPVVFMSQAILRPDSPAIALLSWFPPFTPFLAPARAAADPSPAGMLGTLALTAVTAAASVYVSGRAFRAGALSSGRGDGRSLLLRVFRPQAEG